MTSSVEKQTTPEDFQELHTDSHHQKTYLWSKTYKKLLHQILVTLVVNSFVIGGLIYSYPWWEACLFPQLQKIGPLQRDLLILQTKVGQIEQTVENISGQDSQITDLKNQIALLEQNLLVLERKLVKQDGPNLGLLAVDEVAQDKISQDKIINSDIHFKKWQNLQSSLERGEVCLGLFNEFKSQLAGQVEQKMAQLIHPDLEMILAFAQFPAKSVPQLKQELANIIHNLENEPIPYPLIKSPTALSGDKWYTSILAYVFSLIKVSSNSSISQNNNEYTVLQLCKEALNLLEDNKLEQAVNLLIPTGKINEFKAMQEWLREAKKRQDCNQNCAKVTQKIITLITNAKYRD